MSFYGSPLDLNECTLPASAVKSVLLYLSWPKLSTPSQGKAKTTTGKLNDVLSIFEDW